MAPMSALSARGLRPGAPASSTRRRPTRRLPGRARAEAGSPDAKGAVFNRAVLTGEREGARKSTEFDARRLRKYLLEEAKWDAMWVRDVVDDMVMGRRDAPSVATATKVVEWCRANGLSDAEACNVAARSPGLLSSTPEHLDSVGDVFKRAGVPAEKVARVLIHHPHLVDYDAQNGKLMNGPTEATVNFDNGKLTCNYRRH